MVGVMAWALTRPGSAGIASGSLITPAGATDSGAVLLGKVDAPVTVTVYADFMCPFCGRFERANGEALQSAVAAGTGGAGAPGFVLVEYA